MDAPQGDASVRPFVTTERVRLAQAIRHLIDAALTAEDASDDELAAAADKTERIATDLHGHHDLGDRPSGVRQREEMSHDDYLPRSPLVGEVSPLAPPIDYEYREGRLVGRGTFHAAYEGPPGYVHGGWIALSFDEMLGMANIASGHPGMTGRLSVRYRRPTPLHRPVEFEAWPEEVDGLFVVIDLEKALEYFGERAYERRHVVDPLP
jgi:acyl-coenzyme A thioesterase PaaI-like protein